MTRRDCLNTLAGAAAASALPSAANAQEKMIICAFSKHFQWTDVKEMSDLCAGFGYEGIDLTLRAGGHVLPERVEDDLPKAVEIIKKAGLKIPMVTAGIEDTSSPYAEKIVKTLAAQGIRKYRWGGYKYKDNVSIPEQLAEYKVKVKDLAALNKQYGVCAMYHTHSGIGQVGASMWDLYLLLKDYDTNAVSVNYDVGHATVEGGFGGWIHSSRLLMPYIRGVAVKDFKWKQNEKGVWQVGWCALGQGMVNFKRFLPMLKAANFNGPLQLHMEYPDLGGADSGKTQFTIPKQQLLSIFKRDLDTLKALCRETGLA
jgi:sugar phosphate isomerase/epimerase